MLSINKLLRGPELSCFGQTVATLQTYLCCNDYKYEKIPFSLFDRGDCTQYAVLHLFPIFFKLETYRYGQH